MVIAADFIWCVLKTFIFFQHILHSSFHAGWRISSPAPTVRKHKVLRCYCPAPPESLVCITGTLRWTGRGWRSRVSGANAFMLLIQLLSGVIPACQFVWAADLHNEFILASVLHTLLSLLPLFALSSVPLYLALLALQLLPLPLSSSCLHFPCSLHLPSLLPSSSSHQVYQVPKEQSV